MKNSLLYSFLHGYVKFCSKLYFNRLEIHGLENIPKKGPVILTANHQNAFLDAILVHVTQPRPPHFLTRGDVFSNPIANLLLRSLKMRPIFRFRDGLAKVKKNKSTFSECYDILESGLALGVFPEGNHDLKFNLRPLQKGTARIVYDTEARNNFELDVAIIPVGIQYYGNQNAQSDVLIQFGKPIMSSEFAEFKDDPKTYHQALTERIKAKMSNLIIDIPLENYDRVKRNWLMKRKHYTPLKEIFQKDKSAIDNSEFDYLEGKGQWYKGLLAPLAAFGLLNHVIIYPFYRWLIQKITSEDEFLGSIKFVFGMVVIPVLYILQTLLLYPVLGNWAGVYFILLPISGIAFRKWLIKRLNKIWAISYTV
ncbi:MAG: 1-acyl-sn-glycerol-3-phosphate acyltransferase [Bacteroidia bacterium]